LLFRYSIITVTPRLHFAVSRMGNNRAAFNTGFASMSKAVLGPNQMRPYKPLYSI
jgi:hypothetical protein